MLHSLQSNTPTVQGVSVTLLIVVPHLGPLLHFLVLPSGRLMRLRGVHSQHWALQRVVAQIPVGLHQTIASLAQIQRSWSPASTGGDSILLLFGFDILGVFTST